MKWAFSSDTGEETLHAHYSGLPGQRGHQVSTVILRIYLKVAGHMVLTWGRRDSAWLFLRFHRTKFFNSVEFFLGDGLKISIHQWHWVRDFASSFFRFPETQNSWKSVDFTRRMVLKYCWLLTLGKSLCTVIAPVSCESELFESVVLYLEDAPEMAVPLVVTLWGKTIMVFCPYVGWNIRCVSTVIITYPPADTWCTHLKHMYVDGYVEWVWMY